MPEIAKQLTTFFMSWKRLSRQTAFTCPYYRVEHDRVVTNAGQELDYYLINVRPSVMIVAVTDQDEIVMINQYRYPMGGASLEIPGGNAEGGDLLEGAKKELEEEVGMVASSWTKLGSYFPYNGLCSDECHIFLAYRLTETQTDHEMSEEIEIRKTPSIDVKRMMGDGTLRDGQTIAALALYFAHQN